MQNQMIHGLSGYVLSPFGDVDMNDPSYGWGGTGASTQTAQPVTTGTDIGTILGSIGKGVLSIFAPAAATPTTPTTQSLAQQQQALLTQQQATAAAASAKNMPYYLAGGLVALLAVGFLLKK